MVSRLGLIVAGGVLACALPLALAACFSGAGRALGTDDASSGGLDLDDGGGFTRSDADLGDPFGLDGLTPSHGPFTGGTNTRIAGRGFSSKLHVYLGGVEVPPESLLASDPTRAAIVTPPGMPGFVDVRIKDDVTAQERVLKNGFYYDAFVVRPSTGATSGGTRIALEGSGTSWAAGTTVNIDGKPCSNVVVASPTRIECLTPVGTPGAKDVEIVTGSADPLRAREAFTYNDGSDGYRGGLAGGVFSGRVTVLAFDSYTGAPISGAYAIAGGGSAPIVKTTSALGVTEIDGLSGTKVTVTVAAECHQPMTFVDVPVDTVTVYLDPVLDPICAKGDPPSTGGRGGRYGGIIEGQLIFPGAGEFEKAGWSTVPTPTRPTERRAAYVFEASSSPTATWRLPAPNEAITPDAPGVLGYSYSIVVFPGNSTIYIVAGLEDRSESPPRFVPYAMGVARGITVPAQTRVTGVDVKMDVLFDHQVTLAPKPPAPGPFGPDRFTGQVALTLGSAGYAILPNAERTVTLPAPEFVPFVGVPSLDRAISGEQYVLGAVASTGPDRQRPASVVSRIRTTNANTHVEIGGFLGVPVLAQPGAGAWNGTHVEFSGAAGAVDLTVVDVTSGAGLVSWTIAAPGAAKSFDLPDLSVLPKNVGLVRGAISSVVHVARINDFDYGRLRLGQLSPAGWSAYAFDGRSGAY